MFTSLIYEKCDGIAVISLNVEANLNALSAQMHADLLQALKLAADDPEVRVVVLRSTGRAFCSGGDVSSMYNGLKERNDSGLQDLVPVGIETAKLIMQMPKPVIAAVNGLVAGAGTTLALSCDLCIAEEGAKFYFAFINVGLIPDVGGIYLMSKAFGINKARELAMVGGKLTAEEAVSYGAVYKIFTKEEFHEKTMGIARSLANGPGKAYAALKKLIYQNCQTDFEDYIPAEYDAQIRLAKTRDFAEAVSAFTEKRKAVFVGD